MDPTCLASSCGYRKGRSPHEALRKVWRELKEGRVWLVAADLRQCCDPIDQAKLIELIAEEISDGRVLHLVRAIRRAGVMEEGSWRPTLTGVPQGGVASPLWSNIFLTPFDRRMAAEGFRLTRWADDCVVRGQTREAAQRALASAERILREELGVELHPLPGVQGEAGPRASAAGLQAPQPGQPAEPVCHPPGEVGEAVPGADSSPHETEGPFEAPGSARADHPGESGVGALLPQGGCATALPSARSVDRAPALFVSGQTLAESEVAPVSHSPADRGIWPGATDASDPRSCSPRTPGGSRRGKRLAGKLHEPFDRADGGRAA